MKRSERHRLKENEVALSVARFREQVEERRNTIIYSTVAVVLVLVAVVGYTMWRGHVDKRSREMLATAMAVQDAPVVPPAPPSGSPVEGAAAPPNAAPPAGSYPSERARLEAALPKFMAAAEAYPSTEAGIAARYQTAAILNELGKHAEAIERYKEVVDRAGTGLYGDMARLGLAEAQAGTKQYDAAIAAYEDLLRKPDSHLPADGVLMQLGRTYAAAGKPAEALKTYQRIVDEFPQSSYAPVARREIDAAKAPQTNG